MKRRSKLPEPYASGRDWVLYCGDSIKLLRHFRDKAQMSFTDPPYGVDYEGGGINSKKREKLANDDDTQMYRLAIPLLFDAVDGPCYICCGGIKIAESSTPVIEAGGQMHALIVWRKTNAGFASVNSCYKHDCEYIMFCKGPGRTLRWCGPTNERVVWEGPKAASGDLHPTQKPEWLCARAIRNHAAETVLDPFCGSGSTGVAALRLGRKFIGIEMSETYCERAAKRLQDAERGGLVEGILNRREPGRKPGLFVLERTTREHR